MTRIQNQPAANCVLGTTSGDDGGKENEPHTAAHFYTPILTTEDHSQLRQIDLIADSARDDVFSSKMLLDVACTYRYEDKTGFGQ
ncbi:hypothetical protein KHU50_002844 [Colletotrichum sp. SAR 10_65]|nr:hypothetical protein KHU50_002844 [Colletotrichum sp. SAR 10_65]